MGYEQGDPMSDMPQSDAEWREKLSPEQYQILRKGDTERAFTGEYWDSKKQGTYKCAGCGSELFSSTTKYESGSGWPSFYQSLDPEKIEEVEDRAFGMVRTEIRCKNCKGHLGHLFDDGPNPTGLRYCVNSASIDLEEQA